MTIDIISYTDEQFAAMTEEQILEVESVQLKKNRLTKKLGEEKRTEKFRLLKAGIFRSPVWEKICAALEESYEQESSTCFCVTMMGAPFTRLVV